MRSPNFETTTHAKCIVCGEHAIQRGHPALVIPVESKTFRLSFKEEPGSMTVDHENTKYGENLLIIMNALLDHALLMAKKSQDDVNGHFVVENSIPMGYGLGFSAAICVALAQWMVWKQWIPATKLFKVATRLEDLFHGKSSGLDIAGVLASTPIMYLGNGVIKKIQPKWKPLLCLSDTRHAAKTSECVDQVKQLWDRDMKLARSIDNRMEHSVQSARQAFLSEQQEGVIELQHAFHAGRECFQKWGLVTDAMQAQMDLLLQRDALAVKPTGSGNGGFILSLWKSLPEDESLQLIRV